MAEISDHIRKLLLAGGIAAAVLASACGGEATPPTTPLPAPDAPYILGKFLGYSYGNTVPLTRIEMIPENIKECRELLNSAGALRYGRILAENWKRAILEGTVRINEARLGTDDKTGKVYASYIVVISQNEAKVNRFARHVADNMCTPPEQKTSLHQQLNPHVYSRNGALRPQ